MTVYKVRKIGSGYGLLIRKGERLDAIRYANAEQNRAGTFYNVSFKRYGGKEWNPDKFEWLVIG
jgi:hypothetical protein